MPQTTTRSRYDSENHDTQQQSEGELMARSRNIKPGYFTNEDLPECGVHAHLFFAGLWCHADREGRLEERPRRLKVQIMPFYDVDVTDLLDKLEAHGFVKRYDAFGKHYIQIDNWHKHQNPHHKELGSDIPAPENGGSRYHPDYRPVTAKQRQEVLDRDGHRCTRCGSTEELHIDHKNPITNQGTSEIENLQVLCSKCNTAKNNSLTNHARINDDSSMNQEQDNEIASCPTDSLNLIPDSLNSDSLQGKDSADRETTTASFTEPEKPPVFLTVPLVDKTEHPVTYDDVEEWRESFPGIDVGQELRKMQQWNKSNPKRRKTKRGIRAHITGWLSRAQDKAPPSSRPPPRTGRMSAIEEVEQANSITTGYRTTIDGESERVDE